jgi:hypothetical protein
MNARPSRAEMAKAYATLREHFGDAYADRIAISTNEERLALAETFESAAGLLRLLVRRNVAVREMESALN